MFNSQLFIEGLEAVSLKPWNIESDFWEKITDFQGLVAEGAGRIFFYGQGCRVFNEIIEWKVKNKGQKKDNKVNGEPFLKMKL